MTFPRASHRPLVALLSLPLFAAACGDGGTSSTGTGSGNAGPGAGGNGGDVGSQGGGGAAGSGGAGGEGGTEAGSGGSTTTATSAGSSTSTGGGLCAQGEMMMCYSGPAGTAGKGICKMGAKTCAPDGLSFGPCQGEVVPLAEDCLSSADEDCDGVAAKCTGNQLWAKRFGDVAAQTIAGVATYNGGAVVTGSFAGTVNFGSGALVSAGATDVFVASYNAQGLPLWSKRFGDAVAQTASRVAVDAQGNVAILGDFAGKVDFGGGVLTSAGATDVFLVKLDSNGAFLWAKSFGNNLAQNGFDVAFAPNGDVVFTGTFLGAINLGGGALTSAGAADLFVARLDPAGTFLWGKRFGDAVGQAGKGIAVDGQGNVILVGDIAGTVDFGGGALISAGGTDVGVIKLDPAGTHIYSKLFGNTAAQTVSRVAVDSVGNLLLTGSAAGKVDFGGGLLSSVGGTDIFVAKLTAGGVHLWSKLYGAAGNQDGRDIAVDPGGAVLVAGDFTTTADFGGGVLTSAGVTDGFLVKLDPFGAHVWSKRLGDVVAQSVAGVAADKTGVFAAGTFAGVINFGGGALTSAGATDVVVAKLSP